MTPLSASSAGRATDTAPGDRNLLDAAPVGIAVVDPETRFVRVNRHLAELLGRSEEDLLASDAGAIVEPADRSGLTAALRSVTSGRLPESIAVARCLRPDGSAVAVQVTVAPLRDDDDRIEGALAVVREVNASILRDPLQLQVVRNALDSIPAGAYLCDAEGLITYYNASAAEIWGREPALRDPSDRWCGPGRLYDTRGEPIPPDRSWMALAVREGTPCHGSKILIERADGARRTVLVHAHPLRGDSGEILGAMNVLIDITQRQRDQVSLRESEERFARFMDHLPGLAWIKDLDGRYVFANNAALKAFGRSREDLHGKLDSEIFPPQVVAQDRDSDRNALAALEGSDAVETLAHQDGVHHSLVRKFPIPGPDGSPVLIGGIAIDITEHKLIEAALAESEARFRNMADNAPVLIWVAGLEGREFVNRETLRFLGCSLEDVRGMKWTSFIHPEDRDRYLAGYFQALDRRDLFQTQFRLLRSDGEYRWMQSTAMPRFSEEGTFLGFVGCSYDISGIKRSEEALREADQRKDEFLATLAHELRNPLAPLRYSLEILRMDGGGPAVRRVHDMMERQINHMDRLVDDLLDVSRITRGKIELRRGRIELAAVVRAALETSQPLIELSHHELTVSLPSDRMYLDADAVRLAQVLANLLNNAAKYTDEGGRIWLEARRDGGQVHISVRDDGIGIPREMLPHVFELFTQVDQTLGRTRGGLGIGLTLAKRLVEMHGGRIAAKSAGPGHGSEFIVTLPLAAGQSDEGKDRGAGGGLGATRHRVLVVDDNQDSADALGILLEASGAEVHVAYDGPSALMMVDSCRPTVVLLDLGLPGMDGYVVASRIRSRPDAKHVRLIAVTGWGHPEARRRTREAGFDHHLVKPVKLETLRAVLATFEAPRDPPPAP